MGSRSNNAIAKKNKTEEKFFCEHRAAYFTKRRTSHNRFWYAVDLWPQGQIYRVYDIALCSGHSLFECITMKRFVVSIHDLCMTLTLDLNIKFMLSPWIWVRQDRLCFLTQACHILAYRCITMRQHVVYILDLCMTLTFDLYVGDGVYL